MFQADELLLALRDAEVRFVVIGGIAVGVHGYVRATKDLVVQAVVGSIRSRERRRLKAGCRRSIEPAGEVVEDRPRDVLRVAR